MEEYFSFKTQESRRNFFDMIKEFSGLKWGEIQNQTKISKTSLEGYKRGEFTISKKRFNKLLTYIPLDYQKEILNSIEKLSPISWLSRGGKKAYKINFKKFEEGRLKGMSAIKNLYRIKEKEIKIDFNLTNDLCEVIGAFIGDGMFNLYKNKLYQVEFSGDSNLDLDYYSKKIIPFIKTIIPNINPHIYKVKERNCVRIVFYSKDLFYFFKDNFKFVPGRKTYTVFIPEIIMNADESFIDSTIRGIFDTDGCVFLDKRKIYKGFYPRITLQTVSKPLYIQLKDYLSKHFKIYTAEFKNREVYVIEIYGENQLNKWMNKIGFSNKRHLDKIASVAQSWSRARHW